MQLSVVILAAGQGKRMNSDLPKVLQPLAGEPLLQHVIRAARALNPSDIYVVYGHGGAQVQAVLHAEPVEWVLQADQLGTGHAVMQAMCLIPDEHTVLVLYGDVPLISAASLTKLIAAADAGALAVLSVHLEEAHGYGRIVRNADGPGGRHRRAPRCQPCAAADLRGEFGTHGGPGGAPARMAPGAGKEQHAARVLSDRRGRGRRAGRQSRRGRCGRQRLSRLLGVNDKVQLAQVEAAFAAPTRAAELMLAGATLADPARIDIRGEVEVGRDVFIDINAVLDRQRCISRRGVKIGPNCVIADSRIGAGTEDLRQQRDRSRRASPSNAASVPSRGCGRAPSLHARGAHRQFRRSQEHRDRRAQQGQPSDLPGRFARGQAT